MQSSLGGVVRLTHCSVDVSTRKDFCFAINGRLSSQFFYAKSEAEMQQWMDAIRTCIEEEEAHETRQLVRVGAHELLKVLFSHSGLPLQGKDEVKGNAWIEDEDDPDEPEEEINVQDPIQRLHLQLIRDEKKYLSSLTKLNKMYMIPLTVCFLPTERCFVSLKLTSQLYCRPIQS